MTDLCAYHRNGKGGIYRFDVTYKPVQFQQKNIFEYAAEKYNVAELLLAEAPVLNQDENGAISVNTNEKADLMNLPETYLICYLNGFEEAKQQMELARGIVKKQFPDIYVILKAALRILRKVDYN